MAGFLDKQTRIVDMVLTGYGKGLLSRGELNFCYWVPFDDEIDYKPVISTSGSISATQLSASIDLSIENTPIREATTGYKYLNSSGSDFTNVHRPMYTMPQGQSVLPRTTFPNTTSRQLNTKQRKIQRIYHTRDVDGKYLNPLNPVDIGVERFSPSEFSLEISYSNDSFPNDFQPEGFHIVVYKSGSAGLTEVIPKRDLNNDLAYNNDVKVNTGRKGG